MTRFKFENGQSLRQYCLSKKYDYTLILRRIDEGMTLPEAVADYKKRVKKDVFMIMDNGQRFRDYCEDNDLDYYSIYQKMYRTKSEMIDAVKWWLEKHGRLGEFEAIKEDFKSFHLEKIKNVSKKERRFSDKGAFIIKCY